MKAAHDLVHPDTKNLEGLETFLRTWFVLKFNTHFKDPALLDHSFAELLTLFYVYKISDDPEWYASVNNPSEEDSFDDWVKKQMGEDYVSEEEMTEEMIKYEEEEKAFSEQLPDIISTDFSNPEDIEE